MIAVRAINDDALDRAVKHMVGQCRGFVILVEGYLDEIGSLNDGRASVVVESMRRALDDIAAPGTLRHLEREASALLRSLREEAGDDVGAG